MPNVSEARLRVWIYQELMGILDNKKRAAMQDALNKKQEKGELDALERRIWAAMKLHSDYGQQRRFLRKELALWEKRTAP